VLVVAVGSAAPQDDAAWRVLERLRAGDGGLGWDRCDSLVTDRPGLDLLPALRDRDHVIILDAMRGGGRPGSVRRLDSAELALLERRLSSHALGVADMLALGARLGELPARLDIIGIEAGRSDPATAAVQVAALLREAGIA
jgi:hydrogenase maturation protease